MARSAKALGAEVGASRLPGITEINWGALLGGASLEKIEIDAGPNQAIFMQGHPADAVFFIRRGKVKLSVGSHDGKEAIVATLGAGEFFGEGCLAGQPARMSTATAVGRCTLTRVQKARMALLLVETPALADAFMRRLLFRIVRYEADLVDQLFNSSEKRLARMLLLLSHFGADSETETVVAGISQDHLAQMVGTTRSRINLFMNKFRKLGFIEYSSGAALIIHRGLRAYAASSEGAESGSA